MSTGFVDKNNWRNKLFLRRLGRRLNLNGNVWSFETAREAEFALYAYYFLDKIWGGF